MAKTSKGIYYPYDYSEIADVPEDMKQMAESINKILEEKEVDEATQAAKITTLQNKVNDLQQENTELSSNMPWNTTPVAKSLHITDSAKYSKNRLEISGNMEQETTKGLQLYDDTDWLLKTSDITIDNKHYITVTMNNTSGTSTSYKELHTNLSYLIKPSTEYTFVIEIKSVNGNGILRINSTNNGKIESQFPASLSYNLNSLTAGQIIKYKATSISDFADFKRFLRSNVLFNAGESGSITFRLSILEGDKTGENFEYEPFTGGKAKPNTNYPSMPQTVTGVQKIMQFGKNWFDGKVELGGLGTTGENNTLTDRWRSTNYINVNTLSNITISLKDTDVSGALGRYCLYNKDKNFISNVQITNSKFTINTSNASYMKFWFLNSVAEIGTDVQIEEDSVATDYEPYNGIEYTLDLESTELCAIKENGNVVAKDRPVYRNSKWQWEKNIKKMVLNGTEAWKNATTGTVNHYRGQLNITESKTREAVCNRFICRTTEAHGEWEYALLEKGSIYINIANAELSEVTLERFKTWLSNNIVTIYYVLAIPEYIDCTAEQSAVFDKLYNNFTLQKGTNNIIVESENGVGVNLELEYMQDLQTKLNLLEAMCVSNASQEV